MMMLSEEQLNNLNKEALVIIAGSLQDQLAAMREQLNTANAQLSDTNRQIELLTEQIRIMNQRHFGRQSESNLINGQLSLFDLFNEAEGTRNTISLNRRSPRSSSQLTVVRKLLASGTLIWKGFLPVS